MLVEVRVWVRFVPGILLISLSVYFLSFLFPSTLSLSFFFQIVFFFLSFFSFSFSRKFEVPYDSESVWGDNSDQEDDKDAAASSKSDMSTRNKRHDSGSPSCFNAS